MNYGYEWLIAGIIMILLEFAAPGLVIIFFGLGAVVTSIASFAGLTESLPGQITLFGTSSGVLFFTLRRKAKNLLTGFSKEGNPAKVEDEFSGNEVRVLSEISPENAGKVEFKGVTWNAKCDQKLAVGEIALILHRDGLTLILKPR